MRVERLSARERGYMVGMIVGDGSLIRHKRRGEFLAKIALDRLRDRDIFEFLLSRFEECGKRVCVRIERGMIILRVWSRSFYEFVFQYVRLQRRRPRHHHTKQLLDIEDWDRAFALGFIGGLIDSDGHVERGKRQGHCGAAITTGSASLRDQVMQLCKAQQINVTCRVNHRGGGRERPRYSRHLGSKELDNLCSEILCVKYLRFHGGPGRI